MIKNPSIKGVLIFLAIATFSCKSLQQKSSVQNKSFGEISKQESITPIRPGVPQQSPFWNQNAHQFIYAPAFDYQLISNAVSYRFDIASDDKTKYTFSSDVPYAPLSSVWASMPTGFFELKVFGLNDKGEEIGLAGSGKYYKAAYFNGPYHKPVMPYDQSAKIALDNLLHKDYVEYWLKHKSPDPEYALYRYPAKIYSALVVGAVTHAKLNKGTEAAIRSEKLARTVADYMLDISFPKGAAWEYFIPTYYGSRIKNKPGSHINLNSNFTVMGADVGNAFLDLYNLTSDKKYFDAANRILETYLKNQLENGSWLLYADYQTGEEIAPNIAIPTAVINFFDRLRQEYKVVGLEMPTKKAVDWVMENPVKTFNWQAQFEDVKAMPPYKRHSREQACDMAIYLMKNNMNIALAEELIRFAEDQFVIWEKPLPIIVNDTPDKEISPGWNSANWITPSVQEQYGFFMPVSRTAGVMMNTYMEAFKTTKKRIYLAKAESIANALELVQQEHKGDYPTMFTKYQMNFWLNSVVYPAKVMMDLQHVKELNKVN